MSRRIPLSRVLLITAATLTVSCVDSDLVHEPGSTQVVQPAWTVFSSGLPPYELPPDARSRRDAPWWTMDVTELADSIESRGGLVFIGFKEAGAWGGVDDWGQVLVSHTTANRAKSALRSLGLTLHEESILMPAVVATVPRALVPVIRSHPLVDYIEPVGRVEFESQDTTWNVQRVRAPETWPSSTGSGVKLLIIDTGGRNDHPDLNPHVIQACDGSDGLDSDGHGTHVAGIAAAVNNTAHVIGVSHGVELWTSKTSFTSNSVLCAIEFGRINGVAVINMSFQTGESSILTDMIKAAYADGIFMAKSAGNTDGGNVTYPGTLFETVAVTALDINNNNASFAAVSPKVELAAPGVNIESTSLSVGISCTQGGFTGFCSGTSMAAPHVAGAAAILKAFNPTWTNVDIRGSLQTTAIDLGPRGRDDEYGYGLIDIEGALAWTPPPPPPPPPFSVSIEGPGHPDPTVVPPYDQCLYKALPLNGTSPYSFAWEVDGVPIGGDNAMTYYTAGTSNFSIEVTVTDAEDAIAINWLDMTVDDMASECLDTLW